MNSITIQLNSITIQLTDNSPEVLAALENAIKRGLLACGSKAEGYAKDDCPVDTGNLRNSINHAMNGDRQVDIGTNTEYAAYVECGTGIYSTTGGGTTKTSWVYMGDDGEGHMGKPMQARPYLKPAVADHGDEYYNLLKDSLRNA